MTTPEKRAGSSISTSLLEGVRAHDPEAWQRMVRLLGPTVYRWCRRAGLQEADAADVGQEVFRSVMGAIDGFRRSEPGDTFRGWLWQVTQYRLRDYWRRRGREPDAAGGSSARDLLAETPGEALPELPDSAEDDHALLLEALELVREGFEPHNWEAFWMVTVDGWSAGEAAERLNMTRGAVYVAKSRVLKRLREELQGVIDFDRVSDRWRDAAESDGDPAVEDASP